MGGEPLPARRGQIGKHKMWYRQALNSHWQLSLSCPVSQDRIPAGEANRCLFLSCLRLSQLKMVMQILNQKTFLIALSIDINPVSRHKLLFTWMDGLFILGTKLEPNTGMAVKRGVRESWNKPIPASTKMRQGVSVVSTSCSGKILNLTSYISK